jgi:hypothetical protein
MEMSVFEPVNPQNAQLIREIVDDRGISILLHFTRTENLPSIITHGLLPRATMERLEVTGLVNDPLRIDGHLDASCLSIGFPNDRLFWTYRVRKPKSSWVVLGFEVALLWEYSCAFCPINAASSSIRIRPLAELQSFLTLAELFDSTPYFLPGLSRSPDIPRDWPTHPQAEVLLFGTVPTNSLRFVHFADNQSLAGYLMRSGESASIGQCSVNPTYFEQRIDSQRWK